MKLLFRLIVFKIRSLFNIGPWLMTEKNTAKRREEFLSKFKEGKDFSGGHKS